MIDVVVTQTGFAGETVTLDVEDGGQDRRVAGGEAAGGRRAGGGAGAVHGVGAGPRVFKFRIAPRAGELVTQNNQREALIEVLDRREKLLYYEGEPRPEMKFLRRAVDGRQEPEVVDAAADRRQQVHARSTSTARTSWPAGFPKTRDELFAYAGIILGSIEAGAFTGDQLRMIGEFVERRGGGLLMLGGARSFSEGGYAGTPVADALPVVLERVARSLDDLPVARLKVRPTRAGEAHALTQIAGTEAASSARWNELPVLTSVNPLRTLKPGATLLLSGTDEKRRTQPVLAYQRYGRGKALALTVQDSWLYQMHASMPLEDMTHENLWRQLLRWVVDAVPDSVDIHTSSERVEAGEPCHADGGGRRQVVRRAERRARGREGERPAGQHRRRADCSGRESGAASTRPPSPPRAKACTQRTSKRRARESHSARAPCTCARRPATPSTSTPACTRRASSGSRTRPAASSTRRTPSTRCRRTLKYAGRGVTTVEERDLWHMPIVLLLIGGLMAGEWAYRTGGGICMKQELGARRQNRS